LRGEGTARVKALMILSRLLARLLCLVTTTVTLWNVQHLTKKFLGSLRPSTESITTSSSCGEANKTPGVVLKTSSPSYPRALFFPFLLDDPPRSVAPTFFVSDCGKIDLLRYGTTARTKRFARMAFDMARECAHAATRILKNGNVCVLMPRSTRRFDRQERRNVRATFALQVMSNAG